MKPLFNVYCDESCHLEHDDISIMLIGSIWCKYEAVAEINKKIREIINKYSFSNNFEIKWNKVSPAKIDFYKELIDLFFNEDSLYYRGVIIPNKDKLNPSFFNRTYNTYYYIAYYYLLNIAKPTNVYRIFIDYKDTRGKYYVKDLEKILCERKLYQISIQQVRSHEVPLVQLTDLISGAITYYNRHLNSSRAKTDLVNLIIKKSGISLDRTTNLNKRKLNLLVWKLGETNK